MAFDERSISEICFVSDSTAVELEALEAMFRRRDEGKDDTRSRLRKGRKMVPTRFELKFQPPTRCTHVTDKNRRNVPRF